MTRRAMSLSLQAAASPRVAGRAALLASLALNAFLAALLAARLLAAPAPEPAPDTPLARMTAALPPEDAARFRAAVLAYGPSLQPSRTALAAAHATLADAIARSPYDPPSVAAALAAWQAAWRAYATGFSGALVTALGTLSDTGRARFAAAARDEDARRQAAEQGH